MAQIGYEYGTSPRKLEPEINIKTKKQNVTNKGKLEVVKDVPRQDVKVSKEQRRKQVKLVLSVLAIFVLLLAVSYQNSQINIKFTEMQKQKKELAALQKENEQLRVNIENSLNLSNIEKEAKEQLGMEKLTNKQTVYVSLPKKDYVEAAPEKVVIEDEKNWFEELIDKILNK